MAVPVYLRQTKQFGSDIPFSGRMRTIRRVGRIY